MIKEVTLTPKQIEIIGKIMQKKAQLQPILDEVNAQESQFIEMLRDQHLISGNPEMELTASKVIFTYPVTTKEQ